MLEVQRIRLYVTLAVRLTAMILLLIGVYGAVNTVLLGTQWTIWMRWGSDDFWWIGFALRYLAVGIVLASVSGPLVRWLVPVSEGDSALRLYARLGLRTLAVALLLVALHGGVETILRAQHYSLFYVRDGFTWIGFTSGLAAAGVLLAILSGPLARWLVPIGRNECPQCGHQLRNLSSRRCPECGLDLERKPEKA